MFTYVEDDTSIVHLIIQFPWARSDPYGSHTARSVIYEHITAWAMGISPVRTTHHIYHTLRTVSYTHARGHVAHGFPYFNAELP